MHPKTLASKLNGKQFRNMRRWLCEPLISRAALNDLVIVYGYSDDVLGFKGAIDEELNAVSGRITVYTNQTFINARFEKGTWYIEVDGGEPYHIYDLDRLFCRGMVFRLKG